MLTATLSVFTFFLVVASALPQTSKDGEPLRLETDCKLEPHNSVEYKCSVNGTTQTCGNTVPHGVVITPVCNPFYQSSRPLEYMKCSNGTWNYVATCLADCGRLLENSLVENHELPWHAAIYSKSYKPYKQICGGSLVTSKIVISAAHCFWRDGKGVEPAGNYAVALGKKYHSWTDVNDGSAHLTDVKEIRIPELFRGAASNFMSDISVVVLETEVVYGNHIRPVCVNFDTGFNSKQIQDGHTGKSATWWKGDKRSQVLNVVDLPYIPTVTCYKQSPVDFKEYITGDKFCAGDSNGTRLCRGDGGSGLAFAENETGFKRYYLRGVTSTAPVEDEGCSWLTTFTSIVHHEHFLKSSIKF